MNKSLKILCSFAISAMLFSNLFPIVASATDKVIQIQNVNGEKVVSLEELVKAMKGKVVSEGDLTYYAINGKVISTNSKCPAFYAVTKDLVGETIPYKTKEIKGITLPDCEATAPKDKNGKLLFPVSALEKYVGLKPSAEGFVIKEEPKVESSTNKPTDTTVSNGSANTSKSSGGSTSSNSSSSSTSKPSTGNSNSGSTATKPSIPAKEPAQAQPQQPASNKVPMSTVKAKLPGFGWQQDEFGYGYRNIGSISISGDSMTMSMIGCSSDFYTCVSNTLYAIIPNGASKALRMLNADSSGSFSSDGRYVNIRYIDGTPNVSIS